MKKKVFVCYRQKTSSDFVEHLVDRLKEMFEVHYDGDHVSVGSVSKMIKEGIDDCTHFILVVDEKTFEFKKENDYVLGEIRRILERKAKDKEIKIIPILKPGCEMPSEEKLKKFEIEQIKDENWEYYDEHETFNKFFSRFLSNKMSYSISSEKRKKRFIWCFIATVITAIGLWGGICIQEYISLKKPKLVFAGGGSVANMIKDTADRIVNIKNYENSLYLDLPSENAWPLMTEEVNINHTSSSIRNKFYPICLSALEAPKGSVFYKVDSAKFVENGTVISYYLGEDTLMVYTNIDIFNDTMILISDLSNYINNWYLNKQDSILNNLDSVVIYSTQVGSGTYKRFQEILEKSINLNDCSFLTLYNEDIEESDLDNKKFIVLTSKYYMPKNFKTESWKKIVVNENEKDKKVEIITKSMYLYFAGYIINKKISIPEEMVQFLKKIQKDPEGIIATQMYRKSHKVITPFDTLMKWEREYLKQTK